MKKILLALVAMFAITLAANAADYRLDESAIDAVIENAVAVSPSSIMGEMNATMHSNAPLHGHPSLDVGHLHRHRLRYLWRGPVR